MSTDAVALIGFVALFVLMLLRVPVGMAMGLVGVAGFGYLIGSGPALKIVGHTSMRTVTDCNFAVMPLFLLMGSFATTSGMSRELFRAANAFLGHLRGGLGIATIAACGGFAAICGSSVATAATFSRVAYPEMRRYGYPQSLRHRRDRGRRHARHHDPALDRVRRLRPDHRAGHRQAVHRRHRARASSPSPCTWSPSPSSAMRGRASCRPGQRAPGASGSRRMRDVWATLLLFVFVIGGIYGGLFTATEAAGMGAGGAFLIGIARAAAVAGRTSAARCSRRRAPRRPCSPC